MSGHALNVVLSRYPATARPLRVPEPLGNAGGASGARLWRYPSGKGTLVARAWPAGGPTPQSLRRIHGWLAAARPLGFVPVPEADLSGETVQEHAGVLWEVAPWMPGVAEAEPSPSLTRLRAAFVALATFHQALSGWCSDGPSPGLGARVAEIDWLQCGGLDALGEALERAPADAMREASVRWLELARHETCRWSTRFRRDAAGSCRLQPCLRDARPDHFLFEGDRVVGLVDFGAMDIETISADLSRLLTLWVDGDQEARAEALAAYAAVRPLDHGEAARIDVFETTSALLGAGRWIRWHFLEGRVFDDPATVARGIERGLERLARLAVYGKR